MPSMTRIALAGVLSLLWMVLVDAAFDHHWPRYSATGWVIYAGGYLIFYTAVWVVMSLITGWRRRGRAGERADGHETTARLS